MPVYSIQAPDGRTYRIQGPDGASQDQIQSEVVRQYPQAGRAAPAPGPNSFWERPAAPFRPRPRPEGIAPGSTEAYLHMWQDLSPTQARQLYTQNRQRLESRVTDPALRQQALIQFNSAPGNQALRQLGGMARVTTTRQEIADVAARARAARSDLVNQVGTDEAAPRIERTVRFNGRPLRLNNDSSTAFMAGARRGFFGIPDRISSGSTWLAPLIDALHAQDPATRAAAYDPLNADERLQAQRQSTDVEAGRNFFGNLVGQITAGSIGGYGIAKGVGAAGTALAESASPLISSVGNIIQRITQLERGAGARGAVRNAGRVALAGGTGGGLQAVGDGSNVLSGIATGAIAGPLLHGAASAVGAGARTARNLLGLEPVTSVLGRHVRTPMTDIQAAMDRRAAQGLPSSIYEVLPLRDRQALDDAIARMPANSRERLANTVRQRVTNMVGETADRVQQIVRPHGPDRTRAQIAADLARSRGEAIPTPEEIALAEQAGRSPIEMRTVQETEARNIMAPFDDQPAFANVDELVPQHPVQRGTTVEQVEDNPEIGATIRRAAGVLRIKGEQLNFRDVTRIMSHLSEQSRRGGIEGDTASQALNHLNDLIATEHPDVAPAIQQMRDSWAARARMISGTEEGAKTRLRENVPVDSAQDARGVRQAFDTPEGTAGRALGQAAQLERDLVRSPGQSGRALDRIATDPTAQAAISANLGNDAGGNIAEVARMQSESARRLSGLDRESGAQGGSDPVHTLQNLMMLSPNTLPSTKAYALSRLLNGVSGIPERQANHLVDMLFSQNPTQISRAMGILNRLGQPGRSVMRDIATGAFAASNLHPDGTGGGDVPATEDAPLPAAPDPEDAAPPDQNFFEGGDASPEENPLTDVPGDSEPAEAAAPAPEDGAPEAAAPPERPQVTEATAYSDHLHDLYQSENPDLLNLAQRMEHQESRGQQHGRDGRPLTSRAGAIGVMQIMPGTAPTAARLAGLEWDPEAYRHDANYNRLLGIAYLSEQLRRYNGDARLALIAYNAGPGVADRVRNGHGHIPAETQDYIARILR